MERRVTRAGRKLRRIIDKSGLSAEAWARLHGFEQGTVSRLLNGVLGRRMSVDLALRFVAATGGELLVEDFRSATAKAAA